MSSGAPEGTDRSAQAPWSGRAGCPKRGGWGRCPRARRTEEERPRAKKPMNRRKSPLCRRATPKGRKAPCRTGPLTWSPTSTGGCQTRGSRTSCSMARPAVAEVRSCVSVRVGRRVRGRAGDRDLDDVLQRRTSALGARGSHAGRGLRRGAGSVTASTSSTLRPTTAGTLVAGFPRGRFYASPGTRVLSFSRASSTTLPADALRGPGPLGAREGAGDVAAGRIERSARPLPVAGAGLDQAAQRLVCGAAPRAVLDGHLIARQADRAVDVADGTGPASSRTPYPTAEQAGPQVLRAPVAAALSSPPPDPLPGLAAALRGLTHEAARFPQLIIIYDQIPDRRRGRGFATGIHLNEALEWSKRPGPPQHDTRPVRAVPERASRIAPVMFDGSAPRLPRPGRRTRSSRADGHGVNERPERSASKDKPDSGRPDAWFAKGHPTTQQSWRREK